MICEDVFGVEMGSETRCAHYGGERDVIALRFGCCGRYYACYKCHGDLADHDAEPWPSNRRDEPAVYCGVCGTTFTGPEYISAEACPTCTAAFNPGCANHYPRYFEWIDE